MTAAPDHLDDLCTQLQHAASRLRGGELSRDETAGVVEDCARLAAEASAELERRVRAAGQEPAVAHGELP